LCVSIYIYIYRHTISFMDQTINFIITLAWQMRIVSGIVLDLFARLDFLWILSMNSLLI
jgi:hypothetical protein